MNETFDLSEINNDLLINAFTAYHRGRYWKYDFDKWLLERCSAIRNDKNVLVGLKLTQKTKYGYEDCCIWDHLNQDGKAFKKLFMTASNINNN